ncbi:cytochrome C biogenesis protein CcsB [Hydrococcus rivularis NIES-593]|uniref:Cytochrome c biogenesis protein CcsB n=1 Tax=Hydrococcus rivularis NIES-593 TaxID=1921803 RepID=A0A1U7HQ42_9CYAN|nr:cytochrome c biogenesis protein [Hydrococcus rivularis]OKH25654.1 cytochrome C biogenesis protein CcsB [Hydrococcus rivularis NIES-593]
MTVSDSSNTSELLSLLQQGFRSLIKVITDLRLAIILLLVIALFSVSGTVIEQGQSLQFYQENYPTYPALFGFITWKFILILGLNHVYSTWWFLSLLILFGTSLTACTFTRQIPALKAARHWKLYQQSRQFQKLVLSAELDTGSPTSLLPLLQKRGYKVFQENQALYARKGIIGRIGPIIVHAGILIILAGGIWGTLTGFLAQEMVASGETFQVRNILESGPLAAPQIPKDWAVKVNRFWIDYTPNGEIDQFYSDLSVINEQGEELDRKTIYVNQPLRYRGVTFYQTDWGIAGVRVQINNSPIFQLPMAQLNTNGRGRLWGTWIPTKTDLSEGVSLIARDLQGTMVVYDNQGNLVGAVRSGMAIPINGVNLKILELVGSTGLQIKADPGVPIVYAGFALLMAGVVMSYVSHSQIWALQEGERFYIGGKTNRAQVSFERELIAIVEELKSEKSARVVETV